MNDPARPRQRGQVLALFAFGALAMVAMVALVVDGGNAWSQQRITQNGTDAASLAGTTVIAQSLGGMDRTDADVFAEIDATATAMRSSWTTPSTPTSTVPRPARPWAASGPRTRPRMLPGSR